MKRCWFGLGLLIVLLALSILATAWMTRVHDDIDRDLRLAAQYALEGDWQTADRHFLQAKRSWKTWEHLRASLADHTPVEDAEGLFAQLDIYCKEEDAHFAAVCQELARKVEAIGQAHGLNAWNIL